MANKARGEVKVSVGGVSFVSCATMRSIAHIEGRLSKPMGRIISEDLANSSYTASLVILQETTKDTAAQDALEDVVCSPKEMLEAVKDILIAAGVMATPGSEGKNEGPKE